MATGTALFIAANSLVGAGVGGVISKASGGSFLKGALVGGLTGAAVGGVGASAAVGAGGSLAGATGSALAKAALPIAAKTALISGGVTTLASTTGLTGTKSYGGKSTSAIEQEAQQTYSESQVSPLTISQLQSKNQNILGTFGNTSDNFTRARLLNA